MVQLNGYMGKILRVDLSKGEIKEEELPDAILKKYVGGTGIGARYLYDEVPPGVEWNDPNNRIIFFSLFEVLFYFFIYPLKTSFQFTFVKIPLS